METTPHTSGEQPQEIKQETQSAQAIPSTQQPQMPMRGIFLDIALDAIVPLLLYKLSKRYISHSELTALMIATTFPLGKSISGVARKRQVDPVAIVVLLGIATSGIALLLGGSPKLLLVRESLFTGVFGLACFVSLLLPRPLMFYFGRYFMAGKDPVRQARYDAAWQFPDIRFSHRLISGVWGSLLLGELVIRVILIYKTSTGTVLFVSPILLGGMTVATIVWTFRYAHQMRLRAIAKMRPAQAGVGADAIAQATSGGAG